MWGTGRGFNEAEAFTPRIFPPSPARESRHNRFNEAEAFTPRISSADKVSAKLEALLQ